MPSVDMFAIEKVDSDSLIDRVLSVQKMSSWRIATYLYMVPESSDMRKMQVVRQSARP